MIRPDKFRIVGNRAVIDRDPNAVLDYTLTFAKTLDPIADSILLGTVVATDGLVVGLVTFTPKTITAWISGGNISVGTAWASATYRFTTINNPARIDERTVYFNVQQR